MSSSKPKVTVLMSAYNADKYIAAAIESILNQTFQDFELVIVDDCSTDETWSVIQKYARSNKKVVAVRNKKNLGGCRTLIEGLKISKGEYIARADNDDWSYPDRLEKQVAFLDTNPDVGIVGGTMEIVNQDNKLLSKRKYHLTDSEIRKHIFLYSPFSHPLVMMRKKVLDKVGYYNPEFAPGDDYELYLRMGTVSKFANLPDTLLKYKVIDKSMTQTMTKRMELTTVKARTKFLDNPAYHSRIIDRLYNVMHYVSIFIIPPKLKLRIYNFLRNSKT